MKLITSLNQLLENINTIENYLTEENEENRIEVINLIKRGACFLCYQIDNEIRFAPSRFIGYEKNNLKKHNKSHKDGTETNVAIEKILKSKPLINEKIKIEYLNYCAKLNIEPNNKKHKFWKLKLEKDFETNLEIFGEFPEGKLVERTHKIRERNSQLIQIAKNNFKAKYGKLFCQVCNFDFGEVYGEIGEDFIEGHHTIPVDEMKENHKSKPEEIAMLCSNCHKMVHRKRPWLKMEQLHSLIKKDNG